MTDVVPPLPSKGRAEARRTFSKPICPASSRWETCAKAVIKRVASAGGEGSIVVSFVHRVLAE